MLPFSSSLYGLTADVRAAVGRLATRILRDGSLDVVMRGPSVEVASQPGRVVLARGWVSPSSDEPPAETGCRSGVLIMVSDGAVELQPLLNAMTIALEDPGHGRRARRTDALTESRPRRCKE